MTTQHTPAPWQASQARNKHEAIDSYWMVRAGQVQVADLFGLTGEQDEDGDDMYISNSESEANARLIAAAPELLAACDELLDVAGWLQSFYNDVSNTTPEYFELCGDLNAVNYLMSEAGRIQDIARAAIAKARQPAQVEAA